MMCTIFLNKVYNEIRKETKMMEEIYIKIFCFAFGFVVAKILEM